LLQSLTQILGSMMIVWFLPICFISQTLRTILDQNGQSRVEIVAADGSFGKISTNIQSDAALKRSVNVIGLAIVYTSFPFK